MPGKDKSMEKGVMENTMVHEPAESHVNRQYQLETMWMGYLGPYSLVELPDNYRPFWHHVGQNNNPAELKLRKNEQ